MGQTRKLGSSLTEFAAADTEVIMIIPHERCRTKWWADRAKGKVTFLADSGFWVSCLYGVAFQMQIHTDISNTPGTFLIDKKGVLRWSYIGEGQRSWADRPTTSQTLAQVKELAE